MGGWQHFPSAKAYQDAGWWGGGRERGGKLGPEAHASILQDISMAEERRHARADAPHAGTPMHHRLGCLDLLDVHTLKTGILDATGMRALLLCSYTDGWMDREDSPMPMVG